MVKVIVKLLGQLKNEVGREILTLDYHGEEISINELLGLMRSNEFLKKYFRNTRDVRHDIILFVDGRDYRVYQDDHVFDGAKNIEVAFIPISHGGIDLQYVTWEEIEKYSSTISKLIKEDYYNVDIVVGIMRGGVIPARLIADNLGVRNIGMIEIMFYQRPGETRQKPVIRQPLTLDISDKNVLIVDDVSDTGKSLQVALSAISLYGPSQIKTATLFIKPWTTFVPDYYVAESSKWIVFPWEKNEVKRELG